MSLAQHRSPHTWCQKLQTTAVSSVHTYTVTPTAAHQPALPLPEASQQPPLPADLRPVLVMDWDPTRPWHSRHVAHAGDADAALAQPQPLPQLALSPHFVGAWSAGVIDPRSWGFGSEPANAHACKSSCKILGGPGTCKGSPAPASVELIIGTVIKIKMIFC